MKKYFYEVSCGFCGCERTGLVMAKYEKDLEEFLRDASISNAESFGLYQDEDFFGERDSVGSEWDDEEGEYTEVGFLDYHYEEYVPEEHDCRVLSVEFEHA